MRPYRSLLTLVVVGLIFATAAAEAAFLGATDVVSFTVADTVQPPNVFEASFGYVGDAGRLFDDIALSPANTGATFARAAGDDPDFGTIAANLTDGVDEPLAIGFRIGQDSGFNFPAESDPSTFGLDAGPGSVDFLGFTVDRIDLVIDELSVTSDATTGTFDTALRIHFEIFGERNIPVTEPSSVVLLVLGAGAAALNALRPRR